MKLKLNHWLLVVVVVVIATGCATIQKRFKEAESANNIAVYEKFLKDYPEGDLADQARTRIEELYFEWAKAKNTIASYEEFLKSYPDSEFAKEAKKRIEELEYEKAKSENTIAAYQKFIEKYPNSEYMENVKNRLIELNMSLTEVDFFIANARNTAVAYEEFVKKHPESSFIQQANKRIAEIKNSKIVITSIPKGAKIYLAPDKDLGESVQHPSYPFFIPAIIAGDKYFIGVTPMTYNLETGRYQVAILTDKFVELEWKKKAEGKDYITYFKESSIQVTNGVKTIKKGCFAYTNEDDVEQIIFIYIDEKLIWVGKLFTIEINPNEEKKLEL